MDLWASQLRGYRNGEQRKRLHVSGTSKKSSTGRQGARGPKPENVTGRAVASNKDLNNCAKLLSQLLDTDVGTLDQEACVSTVHTRKAMKTAPLALSSSATAMTQTPTQNPLQALQPNVLPSSPTSMGGSRMLPDKPVSSTPFNSRLASSTPNMTPTKLSGTAQSRLTGTTGSHPLNSTDEIRRFHPVTANSGPKLMEGTVDFQPSPHGMQAIPCSSAVVKEVLGKDLANFSLYSNTRMSAAAEVPTRDTDPVHVQQGVGSAPEAQQPVQCLLPGGEPATCNATHVAPMSKCGEVHKQPFTVGAPLVQLQPQAAEAPMLEEQRGSAHVLSERKPASDVSTSYTPVQPLTLPVSVRKQSPRLAAPSNASSSGQDKDVPSKIAGSDVDPSSAPCSPPSMSAERSPSKKPQDFASYNGKHANSRKMQSRKKTESKCGRHKVQRNCRSADVEIQVGEDGSIKKGISEEKELSALKEGLHKLQRLTRDLKMVTATKGTVKIKRLARELDDTLKLVLPGMGDLSWQTELDLAMQPVRSENAQLRRKIRLMTRQLQEKEREVQKAVKPDPTVQVLHLQMLTQTLEKELENERLSSEQQLQQLRVAQEEVENLAREKQQMLEGLQHKDAESLKSQENWLVEVRKLGADAEAAQKECREVRKEKEDLLNEKTLMEIVNREKDREIDRLQDLARNLQQSMSHLVQDFQTQRPFPLNTASQISDGLQRIENLLATEVTSAKGRPDSKTKPATSSLPKLQSPARRALHFGQTLPGQAVAFDPPQSNSAEGETSQNQETMHSFPAGTTKGLTVSDELDITDYYIPPGASPFGSKLGVRASNLLSLQEIVKKPTPDHGDGTSEGPTVRELLSDFTERMRASLDISHSVDDQKGYAQPKVPLLELDRLEEVSELSSSELDMTHDRTLVECQEQEPVTPKTFTMHAASEGSPAYNASTSRYSMTDYFQKYPDTDSGRKGFVGTTVDSAGGAPTGDSDAEEELYLGSENDALLVQGNLYKGTALDTSLSTINSTDKVSVGTGSTTSATSTASLDDRMFRAGLAKLDADIAKIQQTLRQVSA